MGTLYMPSEGVNDTNLQKWLRYLVHLRFASSKSGKIYLHTDVRMIIFRKSDLDTAADFTSSKGFELRSFTQGPSNPKFSPRRYKHSRGKSTNKNFFHENDFTEKKFTLYSPQHGVPSFIPLYCIG